MRIKSKAWQDLTKWHRWWAWHFIRLPADSFQGGQWIIFERVERKGTYSYGGDIDWEYRLCPT